MEKLKRICGVIIFIFTGLNAAWAQDYLIAEKPNLKPGKIKSVTTLELNDGQWTRITEETYDKSGKKSEETVFENGETPVIRIQYKYDEKGKMKERIRYDKNGKVFYSSIYKYNENNELSEKTICFASATECEKPVLTFDNANYQVEEKGFLPLGSAFQNRRYDYDDKGRVIADIYMTPEGEVFKAEIYAYPESNDHYKRKVVDRDGKIISEHTIYLKDGKVIREDGIFADGAQENINYLYDEKLNLQEVSTLNTTDKCKKVVQYNKKGKVISETFTSPDATKCYMRTIKYNRRGDIVNEKFISGDREQSSEYKYAFISGRLKEKTFRGIEKNISLKFEYK